MNSVTPDIVPDPLPTAVAARLNYATGVMLDAQDFQDEQTYHRARLARALQYLVGMGTVAGLGVTPPAATDANLTLTVRPGLALDRYGRLIEIAAAQCIRLALWFANLDTPTLVAALHRTPAVAVEAAVVADVFLGWHQCEQAKTPALVTGPFDALDAVVAARLADQFVLTMVPRLESTEPPTGGGAAPTLPTPQNFWPDPQTIADPVARRTQLLQTVIGGWFEDPSAAALAPLQEHVPGRDPSAVLLARVTIPVDLAVGAPAGTRPALRTDLPVSADNSLRPFVFLPGRWVGQAIATTPLVLP